MVAQFFNINMQNVENCLKCLIGTSVAWSIPLGGLVAVSGIENQGSSLHKNSTIALLVNTGLFLITGGLLITVKSECFKKNLNTSRCCIDTNPLPLGTIIPEQNKQRRVNISEISLPPLNNKTNEKLKIRNNNDEEIIIETYRSL